MPDNGASDRSWPTLDRAAVAAAAGALRSPEAMLSELADVPIERVETGARMAVLAYLLAVEGAREATEVTLRTEVIRLRRELDGVCAALEGIEQGAVRHGANDELAAVIAGAMFVMRALVRPYDG